MNSSTKKRHEKSEVVVILLGVIVGSGRFIRKIEFRILIFSCIIADVVRSAYLIVISRF